MEDFLEADKRIIEEVRKNRKTKGSVGFLLSKKEFDRNMLDNFMNGD